MRKNRLFILGIFTVMVALVSLTLVSNTWARYTSTVSGSDSAKVAKWDVEYTGNSATTDGGVTEVTNINFDVFNTIKSTDGNAEANTAANLLAPGTQGSFEFKVENKSEVNATCDVTFTSALTNGGTAYSAHTPVEFTLKEGSTTLATSTSLAAFDAYINEVALAQGASKTYTIEWKWVIGDTADLIAKDTALGIAAQSGTVKYDVTVKVVFTQVD